MDQIEIKYKTCFYSKEKNVVFTENGISVFFGNKELIKLDKHALKGLKYGIRWIRGIEFTIGRTYCIDLIDDKNQAIKIRLKSLYGINRKELSEKYDNLLDKLYDFYFDEKISTFVKNIKNGIETEIAGVIFKKDGVQLFPEKSGEILEWNDLNPTTYTYYYALASKKKPNFYRAFTYLTDWNAVIVYAVSKQILKDKGFSTENQPVFLE